MAISYVSSHRELYIHFTSLPTKAQIQQKSLTNKEKYCFPKFCGGGFLAQYAFYGLFYERIGQSFRRQRRRRFAEKSTHHKIIKNSLTLLLQSGKSTQNSQTIFLFAIIF